MATHWIIYDPTEPTRIPDEPGCYVIYMDGVLVYIGQSVNVRSRIRSHRIQYHRYVNDIRTPWGDCRACCAKIKFSRKYGDWAMWELRLIRRIQPLCNHIGTGKFRESNAS